MKESTLGSIAVQSPATQLARLSGPHGYRFDGDVVHLNAMFALLHPAAHERAWALQLWACSTAPASVSELSGHVVAEVSLPPMGELADEIEHFDVTAFSRPPAGGGEHVMVLVLASGRQGAFHEVQDFAVYPRRQEFLQPRLSGNVGYRIDEARVQISVERVENPRPVGNRSGNLSLELWALPQVFAGGRFEGHHLAGVEIGYLSGQYEVALQPIELSFTPPPAGEWNIILMLREWTEDGFVTRDFVNFPVRYVVAPIVVAAPEPFTEKPVVLAVEETVLTVPETAAAPEVEELEAKPAAAPKRARRAAASPAVAAKKVSINSADLEELAAVKGLSSKLAERIVKKRPFHSLAELAEIKGLGEKVLAKVRAKLKL